MPEWIYIIGAIVAYFGIGIIAGILQGYFSGDFDDFTGVLVFFWPFMAFVVLIIGVCAGPYKLLEWGAEKGRERQQRIKEQEKKRKEERDNGVSDQSECC